jgi:hypothetical protein
LKINRGQLLWLIRITGTRGFPLEQTPGAVQMANGINIVFLNVADDTGKITKWDGEFTTPGTLRRRGWTKEMFKPGEQITLIGNRAKNGTNLIRVLKLQLADGQLITALGGDDN